MSREASKSDEFGGGTSPSGDEDKAEELREAGSNDDEAGTRQPYNCTFCRRGFPTAQALGGHMNVHRKDRVGRAAATTTTTTAAARRSVSYDTLVGLFSTTGQARRPGSCGGEEASSTAAGGGSLQSRTAERAPQELRLFGRDELADRRVQGGGRDRRDHHDGDGNGDRDRGEEELDLELRLGGSGS